MNPWKECTYFDSHTGGEPTRVFVNGFPELGSGSVKGRAEELAKFPGFLNGALNEPRGNEALVGAIIFPLGSDAPTSGPAAPHLGVIFFNPAGPLGMCGHGTIGLVETIRSAEWLGTEVPDWLGKLSTQTEFRFETPAGSVRALALSNREVQIENVDSFRLKAGVHIKTSDHGEVAGDIAYGGNWFFLAKESPLPISYKNRQSLLAATLDIKQSLARDGITGENGSEIDHVELFGPPENPSAKSKNFVLCPGGAYDRSPCGTGTSAKIACLAADGKLAESELWVQESIAGSLFTASYQRISATHIRPKIQGRAHMSGRGHLIFEADDPFQNGIQP